MAVRLPRLTVLTPCTQDWDAMPGNDRVRFCMECARDVYNVAGMSQRELLALIERSEGRLPCMGLYQRPNGTIVTRDCRLRFRAALRAARWRALAMLGSAAALIVGLVVTRTWRLLFPVDELSPPPELSFLQVRIQHDQPRMEVREVMTLGEPEADWGGEE